MTVKQLVAGLAALPLLAGMAIAGQPAALSDTQMDRVTAGLVLGYSPVGSGLVSGCSIGGVDCGNTPVTVTVSAPISDGATGLASFGSIASRPLSVCSAADGPLARSC